jgi:predicted RNA-binding protein
MKQGAVVVIKGSNPYEIIAKGPFSTYHLESHRIPLDFGGMMNPLRSMIGLLLVGLVVAPLSASAVPGAAGGASIASIKVGRWVQLEGTLQKDQTVLCSEVKILTGDFLNDDWSIRGPVRAVDAKSQRITIERFNISLAEDVEYDDPTGAMKKFGDLKPGMVIEVEGTYLKDKSFFAKEVEDKSQRAKTKPSLLNKIQIVAKAENVDLSRRAITAMGTTFIVNDRTQIKSVIK